MTIIQMPKSKKICIIGIDPGFGRTGFGLIMKSQSDITALDYGVIETSSKLDFSQRLMQLHIELKKIIEKHQPQIAAIEDLFFTNNSKTAIKVGQARGASILTAALQNVTVYNFTPLQVKQAVTSYGRAEKKQIQKMMKLLLDLESLPHPDDAADALAVAYCCAQSLTTINAKK